MIINLYMINFLEKYGKNSNLSIKVSIKTRR